MIDLLIVYVEWLVDYIFQMDIVIGYFFCNVKWFNVLCFDFSNKEGKCFYFIVFLKGIIFVIFVVVLNNKDIWYYVQIFIYGVGIFKVSLYKKVN